MLNLINGDCYQEIKKIPDKSIDLIITDPPYEIKGLHIGTGILKDRPTDCNYVSQMMNANLGDGIDTVLLGELVRVLKNIYIYMVQ
jgi:DNA modification methylase